MAESGSERDPVERLAESFLARFRAGERPALAEIAAAHPELADQIWALFPALIEMEQAGSAVGPVTDSAGPTAALDCAGPESLGDYRIIREIGRGGMAVVYEAVQESLGRHVALKVFTPSTRTDPTLIERFQREARAAARLHHTNIVPVFGVGEHGFHRYYAMQFIQGQGLDAILRELRRLRPAPAPDPDTAGRSPPDPTRSAPLAATVAHSLLTGRFADPIREPRALATHSGGSEIDYELRPLPQEPATAGGDLSRDASAWASQPGGSYARTIARVGLQVAEALAHAHGQGILHRDIKPSNLLLDIAGNVWVTDFGLAKSGDADALTEAGDIVGTVRYMAPERFRGISGPESDVYGLGMTLYELLTLRYPFNDAGRARLIDHILYTDPPPPRSVDAKIPRDLETIVLKAIAKDPADRYVSSRAMADDLDRFLQDRTILARRSSVSERLWRWCRRNPGLAAANITAAVLTTVLAIGSTTAAWIYRDQRNDLRYEQLWTKANLDRAEKAEHQAQLAMGQSLVSEGAALQRTGLIGQRFDSLDRLARAAKVLGADPEGRKRLPEIRNQAIAALGLTDLRVRRLHEYSDYFEVNVDTALQRYAVAEKSGEIVVRRLDDDRVLVRLPGPDRHDFWHAWSAFSPDGELLVAVYLGAGGELLRVWHTGRRELLGSLSSRGSPAFHPDGRRLLFCVKEGGIAVWDHVERRVLRRLPLDFMPSGLVLDPEGRRLAVGRCGPEASNGPGPRVAILEIETGRVLFDWRSQVGSGAMAWSADGQLLAVGGDGRDPRVYVWNVRRGVLASVLQGHSGVVVDAQFAHSGYLLATSSWDGPTRLWDAALGEPLAMAPGGLRSSFAPDDRRLGFAVGGKVGVWDVATGAECRTLHPGMLGNRTEMRDQTLVQCSDVSPDGRLIATGAGDGVRLWEADTGRELAHLKAGLCETVLFHPDGQCLISSSKWGLYRWPIRPDPDRAPDAIFVGPPDLLREYAGTEWARATWVPDHRTLALVDNANAQVLLIDTSHPHAAWSRAAALDSGANHRMTSVSVSPDGRWLAAGGWKEAGVRVWDLGSRRLERILTPPDTVGDTSFFIGFSPDGRWLVSCTLRGAKPSYRFWRVGTWNLGLCIEQERNGMAQHAPAFTGDGRLMALGIAPDQVLLADAATGRELARLTTLQPVTPTPLVFSPDGTKLIARTEQKTALVWDLRLIRDELRPMGLDWDAPPYPPEGAPSGTIMPGVAGIAADGSGGPTQIGASDWAFDAAKAGSTPATRTPAGESAGSKPSPIRSVRVIGEVIETQARRAAELAEMSRRLAAKPDDAEALIHRGWLFTQQKKWPDAIADLEQLLRLRPGDSDVPILLTKAYLETNNLPLARTMLHRHLVESPGDSRARSTFALLALLLGKYQEAAENFTRLLDEDPSSNFARCRRTRAFLQLGRFEEALTDLNALIQKFPGEYDHYELRALAHEGLGQQGQAEADRKRLAELLPRHSGELGNLAWTLVTGPFNGRDPMVGLSLARKAVALAPGQHASLNTLGVARYRMGQYAEAISVLEQSLAVGKGELDAFDLFFLAMAHQKLGHASQARACFYRAVRWWGEHKNLPAQYVSELTGFRAEAEAVLAAARSELPAEVFAPQ
jgi:serine/threonine protein kinase/WD40 repeat protein/tetratricopeptide (TPR) repeat protein